MEYEGYQKNVKFAGLSDEFHWWPETGLMFAYIGAPYDYYWLWFKWEITFERNVNN